MYWMLLHADDAPGIWLYQQLHRQGVAVELVTVEEWFANQSLTITMDETAARAQLQLQDGRWWQSDETRAVMARVRTIPTAAWQLFADSERDYVAQEWQAVFMAWAELMPMLFNQPTPMGLSGRNRRAGEWHQLAATVGFDTLPLAFDSAYGFDSREPGTGENTCSVLVYRGRCYAPAAGLSASTTTQLCRLQADSGDPLIGVSLLSTPTGLVFSGATTQPDLRLGGQAFVHDVITDLHDGIALRSAQRRAPVFAD